MMLIARLVVHRLLVAVPTLLIVSMLAFGLQKILPGDPLLTFAGEDRDPAVLEALREQYHLNDPLPVQYVYWVKQVLHGDLGISLAHRLASCGTDRSRNFRSRSSSRLWQCSSPWSSGCRSGSSPRSKKGSWFTEAAANVFALVRNVGPEFLARHPPHLLSSPCNGGCLPASGYVPMTEDLLLALKTLIMPAIVLASPIAAYLMRHTRSAMLEALNADYVRTARAKGVPAASVILRHALRNALVPIVTLVTLLFGELMAGAVLTEQIFSIPGFGKLMVDAVFTRDYAVVQGVVLCAAAGFIAMNLLADVLYVVVNPRLRHS